MPPTHLCPLTCVQVHHPVDYSRVVKRIGNEMDLTLLNLDDILPAATVMVVTVTVTTTCGKPLSEENMAKVIQGCDLVLQLDDDKRLVSGCSSCS